MRTRRIAVALTATAATLALPAAASAAVGATLTGDDGNPVAITPGLTVRNMSVKAGIAPTADDTAQYAVAIAGPDGVPAATSTCISAKYPSTRNVDYRGNGTYTLTATPHASDDYDCTKAATGAATTFTWNVAAAMTIGPAANNGVALLRKPNTSTTIPVTIPATLSPGGLTTDIHYALGGVVGPDGAISGPSDTSTVNSTTGLVTLYLSKPGTYVLVGRQQGFSSASGSFFTPWTAPVTIKAYAPFDLSSVSFPDSIGPSYLLKGYIKEPSASGRVSIAVAKGKKGKYRSLGSVKISTKATFSKRLRASTGSYRLRVRYKGNATTVAGTITGKFRVTRRFAG